MSRDRISDRSFMGRDQVLKIFSLYILSFFLYSPFNTPFHFSFTVTAIQCKPIPRGCLDPSKAKI